MREHGPPDVPPPSPPPAAEAGPSPGWLGAAETLAWLERGGPAIWAIAALSVATLALVLWKTWRLARAGVWRRARAERAVALWLAGKPEAALAAAEAGRGVAARIVAATLGALQCRGYEPDLAREEATRVARAELAAAGSGLRALELVATIAPLLGLLGTVLGMIAAFRALQETGARADPAALAGGIWEALLTTAAGMAVAIPASAALALFEGAIARLRRDAEDMASRILTHAEHRARQRAPGRAVQRDGAPALSAAE